MSERHCLKCVHCCIYPGWSGTDVTPGDPAEMHCKKGHWNIEHLSKPELCKAMETAETCPDYEPDPPALPPPTFGEMIRGER